MKTRKQSIEEIIENMQAIRHKFATKWHSKTDKPGGIRDFDGKITSSQWSALVVIARTEDISITELAEILGITTSATTQLVDELVTKGYVVREEKIGDRRSLSLSLSNICKKKIGEMKSKRMGQFKSMFDVLTDKELEQYANLNKKIIENILKK